MFTASRKTKVKSKLKLFEVIVQSKHHVRVPGTYLCFSDVVESLLSSLYVQYKRNLFSPLLKHFIAFFEDYSLEKVRFFKEYVNLSYFLVLILVVYY